MKEFIRGGITVKVYNENGYILNLSECSACTQEFPFCGSSLCYYCAPFLCRGCDSPISDPKYRVIHKEIKHRPYDIYICRKCFDKWKQRPTKSILCVAAFENWKI